MLSAGLAEIVLTVYPELDKLGKIYRARADKCLSFEYNTEGRDAAHIFDEYFSASDMCESIKQFKLCMDTALKILSESEREVICSVYFRKETLGAGCKRLGLDVSRFRYLRGKCLKKVRAYIEILGFGEERILNCFDSEPDFISAAREVEKRKSAGARFNTAKQAIKSV